MVAYERFESAQNDFGKFIHQFQPETKTLIRKLERNLIKFVKVTYLGIRSAHERVWLVEGTIYCIFLKIRENTNLAQGLKMGGEAGQHYPNLQLN